MKKDKAKRDTEAIRRGSILVLVITLGKKTCQSFFRCRIRSVRKRKNGSLYTGSLYTGSLYTGSLYIGSLYTGSLHTGSAQTGSVSLNNRIT